MMKGAKTKGNSLQKYHQTIKRIKTPQVIVKSNGEVCFKPLESLELNFVKQLM